MVLLIVVIVFGSILKGRLFVVPKERHQKSGIKANHYCLLIPSVNLTLHRALEVVSGALTEFNRILKLNFLG